MPMQSKLIYKYVLVSDPNTVYETYDEVKAHLELNPLDVEWIVEQRLVFEEIA